MKFLKFLFVIIVIFPPLNLLAEDQNEKSMKIHEGKWIVNCSPKDKKVCALERSVFVDKEMTKKLVTMVVTTKSPSKDVRFTLISPLGTLIPSGVKIGFDGKLLNENGFGFNICRQIGCITSMMIKEQTLQNFKKANDMNLEYVGADGKKINISFGLDGFTKQLNNIL